jgi:hypothetical protein
MAQNVISSCTGGLKKVGKFGHKYVSQMLMYSALIMAACVVEVSPVGQLTVVSYTILANSRFLRTFDFDCVLSLIYN